MGTESWSEQRERLEAMARGNGLSRPGRGAIREALLVIDENRTEWAKEKVRADSLAAENAALKAEVARLEREYRGAAASNDHHRAELARVTGERDDARGALTVALDAVDRVNAECTAEVARLRAALGEADLRVGPLRSVTKMGANERIRHATRVHDVIRAALPPQDTGGGVEPAPDFPARDDVHAWLAAGGPGAFDSTGRVHPAPAAAPAACPAGGVHGKPKDVSGNCCSKCGQPFTAAPADAGEVCQQCAGVNAGVWKMKDGRAICGQCGFSHPTEALTGATTPKPSSADAGEADDSTPQVIDLMEALRDAMKPTPKPSDGEG